MNPLPSLLTLPFDAHRADLRHNDNFKAIRINAAAASNQTKIDATIRFGRPPDDYDCLSQSNELNLIRMACQNDQFFCDYVDRQLLGASVPHDTIYSVESTHFDTLVAAAVVVERERMQTRWETDIKPVTERQIPELQHRLTQLEEEEERLGQRLGEIDEEAEQDPQIQELNRKLAEAKTNEEKINEKIDRLNAKIDQDRKEFHQASTTEKRKKELVANKKELVANQKKYKIELEKTENFISHNTARKEERMNELRREVQDQLTRVSTSVNQARDFLRALNDSLQQRPEDRFQRNRALADHESWLVQFCRHYWPKVQDRLVRYAGERTRVSQHRDKVKSFQTTGYHQLTDRCYIIDDAVNHRLGFKNTEDMATQPWELDGHHDDRHRRRNERPSIYAMITYMMTHLEAEADLNHAFFNQNDTAKQDVLQFLDGLMTMLVYKLECFQYSLVGRIQAYISYLDATGAPDTSHELSINGVWVCYLMHRCLLYELFCLQVKLRVFDELEDAAVPVLSSSLFVMPYMDANVLRENTILHLTRNWRNVFFNTTKRYGVAQPVLLQNPIDPIHGGFDAFDAHPFVNGGLTQQALNHYMEYSPRTLRSLFIANNDAFRPMALSSFDIMKPFIRSMMTWVAGDSTRIILMSMKFKHPSVNLDKVTIGYLDMFSTPWKKYLYLRKRELRDKINDFERSFQRHAHYNTWLKAQEDISNAQRAIRRNVENLNARPSPSTENRLRAEIQTKQNEIEAHKHVLDTIFDRLLGDVAIQDWDNRNRNDQNFPPFAPQKLTRFCIFAIAHATDIQNFRDSLRHSDDRHAFDNQVRDRAAFDTSVGGGHRSLYDFFSLLDQHNLHIKYCTDHSRGLAVFAERTRLFR
jgi:hypothetical protein